MQLRCKSGHFVSYAKSLAILDVVMSVQSRHASEGLQLFSSQCPDCGKPPGVCSKLRSSTVCMTVLPSYKQARRAMSSLSVRASSCYAQDSRSHSKQYFIRNALVAATQRLEGLSKPSDLAHAGTPVFRSLYFLQALTERTGKPCQGLDGHLSMSFLLFESPTHRASLNPLGCQSANAMRCIAESSQAMPMPVCKCRTLHRGNLSGDAQVDAVPDSE